MVVAALDHRQGGLTDREHIPGLDQSAGVALQYLLGVIQYP